MMKRILLPIAALAMITTVHAQKLPQLSPKGEVEQTIGLTEVEVNYSRPSVRDRQIFGDLVPYDRVWRLGANANTTIEFDGPVEIDGQILKKGKYAMLAIPGKEAWEIIFNKDAKQSVQARNEQDDVLRVKAKAEPTEFTETFTISFDEVKDDKARMDLRWEKTRVSVWIKADATEQGLENIKKAMSGGDVTAGGYANAAAFAIDRGMMLEEALGWAQTAVKMAPQYYFMHTLALAQAANGQVKEAIVTAQKSMEQAREKGDMAYVKRNEAKLAEWKK